MIVGVVHDGRIGAGDAGELVAMIVVVISRATRVNHLIQVASNIVGVCGSRTNIC